jgi:hemolysin activation/secretion protein
MAMVLANSHPPVLDRWRPVPGIRRLAISAALSAVVAHAVQAQTAPDAGSVRQQIEQARPTTPPRKAAPPAPDQAAAPAPASGVTLTVKAFRFSGNTLLSDLRLSGVVAPYRGRPIDFSELQAAAQAVAAAYREAGWIARAYLPRQDIEGGLVSIRIVEARQGQVIVEGGESRRVASERIVGGFDARQHRGYAIEADALDRALLLADDLPGVQVAGALRAGTREQESDIVLTLTDEALLIGDVGLDNTGERSTGATRLSANAALQSPLRIGDLLAGHVVHSSGTDALRAAWSLPVGFDGWRVGAHASTIRYRLVQPAFVALGAHGDSSGLGIEASWPLLRSRLRNIYLSAAIDHNRFDNQSAGATTTRYRIDSLSLGVDANSVDGLGGGGSNRAALQLVGGRRKADVGVFDQTYARLRYSLSRQQSITENLTMSATLTGQASGQVLDSSERFYLGGAGGVRAYPASEAGGSSGTLVQLELRRRLPAGLSIAAHVDHGVVKPDDRTGHWNLNGAGLSLAWQAPRGISLQATWSRRIGHNPNPTADGLDQDGSLVGNRLWLSTGLAF